MSFAVKSAPFLVVLFTVTASAFPNLKHNANCMKGPMDHKCDPKQSSFLVQLAFPVANRSCQGTIVHPFWIITSRSCFDDVDALSSVAGAYVETNGEKAHIVEVIRHENYSWQQMDIVLTKVNRTFASWKPIKLPKIKNPKKDCRQALMLSNNAQTGGFGCARYSIVEEEKCAPRAEIAGPEGIYCADTCSCPMKSEWHGAPMVCPANPNTLIGIFSERLEPTSQRTTFVRIDSYLDFIRSTIK